MDQKFLSADKIIFRDDLYPRREMVQDVVRKYKVAIEAGAEFPPITVSSRKRLNEPYRYILVDGAHRLEAYKHAGYLLNIPVEVLENLTDDEIYLESIKRNAHGIPFTDHDRSRIAVRLSQMQIEPATILQLVQIQARESVVERAESVVHEVPTSFKDKGKVALAKAFLRMIQTDLPAALKRHNNILITISERLNFILDKDAKG